MLGQLLDTVCVSVIVYIVERVFLWLAQEKPHRGSLHVSQIIFHTPQQTQLDTPLLWACFINLKRAKPAVFPISTLNAKLG